MGIECIISHKYPQCHMHVVVLIVYMYIQAAIFGNGTFCRESRRSYYGSKNYVGIPQSCGIISGFLIIFTTRRFEKRSARERINRLCSGAVIADRTSTPSHAIPLPRHHVRAPPCSPPNGALSTYIIMMSMRRACKFDFLI